MFISLLLLAVIVGVVVVAIRKGAAREHDRPVDGHTVRQFFQYLLLYGLLVVVGVGLSGLVGRILGAGDVLVADETQLARSLAFTVVGVPLYVGVALWTRRRFAEDPEERRSVGWAFYVGVASLTSLVLAMTALGQVLAWAMRIEEYSSTALAQVVVWGGLWGAHWWVDRRLTPPDRSRAHHLAGSLIGLLFAATGLAGVLAGVLRYLLGLDGEALLAGDDDPIRQGLVTLLVGAPVWALYWVLTASRAERDVSWLAYVLLAGVGGGLVTAIVSASMLLYSVLVWLLGEPRATDPVDHFRDAPTMAAVAVVGGLVWWYHHAVLQQEGDRERTEVRRVYEYLMAGIGLLAAAGGLGTLVVALIEAATGNAGVLVRDSIVNTLLAALTLLAVGAPVWWLYWRRAQAAVGQAPVQELVSPTRRVYLLVLFGVGGVAAVVALLVGVYLLFEDVVGGGLGLETLRRMRFSIGVLLATGAVAAYHWTVFRSDRQHAPQVAATQGPRFVLLVGPHDPSLASAVAHHTHGRVQAWSRTDGGGEATWSVDEILAALGSTSADEVIVLADSGGVRAIPVHRG